MNERIWRGQKDAQIAALDPATGKTKWSFKVEVTPVGVVHAYKNVGREVGIVLNAANRLYKGVGRKEPVDEIRHEDRPDSPFQLE